MAEATMETAERKREYNRRYMRLQRDDPVYRQQKREYMRKYNARRRARTIIIDEREPRYTHRHHEAT